MIENYKWKKNKNKRGEHKGWVCPFCHWETVYFELGYAVDKVAYEYCPMCGKDMNKDREVK